MVLRDVIFGLIFGLGLSFAVINLSSCGVISIIFLSLLYDGEHRPLAWPWCHHGRGHEPLIRVWSLGDAYSLRRGQ